MNRIMKRMALPVGAAAILGTTGFAFMASNTVAVAGLGEGYSPAAGYTATNIGFNGYPNQGVGSNCGGNNGCGIATVQFHLASDAEPGTQAYNQPPKFVFVSLLKKAGTGFQPLSNSGAGGAGTSDCVRLTTWNNGPAGADYSCTVHGTGTLNTVDTVDVAANQ